MADGTFIAYQDKKLGAAKLRLIDCAIQIIDEYEKQGYVLTLRQLYYQFVARGLIENTSRSYDSLGSAVNDGRLCGMISWTSIEDRTRSLHGLRTHRSPGAAISEAAENFRMDLWRGQPFRPQIWVEKEALAAVVERVCGELRVDFFPCRGYVSQSEQWRAGRRLRDYVLRGQTPVIFHLGDHDPSGLDMTRDNRARLETFAGVPVAVERLALNMDQVEKYSPPPNPAKVTDSRFEAYRAQFGDESWELDALPPNVIHDLIERAVMPLRDEKLWDQRLLEEVRARELLEHLSDEYGDRPKKEKTDAED
jgi:hypothetical protein